MSLTEHTESSPANTSDASAASHITTYGAIALGRIAFSPTNPRTRHNRNKLQLIADDPKIVKQVRALLAEGTDDSRKALAEILGSEKLAEFVASIHAHNVNQPVLLRPLPASRLADAQAAITGDRRPDLELVSGERRCFGSLLTGKDDIPAMVKPMTDQEVLEFQLVENLQREDLHPMEEAEGYERLCRDTGIQKEDVGAKVGKSRSYVYGRLKLLDLCTEARQAFYDGLFDASRALLIARIPDQKLQMKALEELTRNPEYPPSVRNFQRWLHDNVMLRLDRAVFKITSADLLPAAGSCRDCPKRTGAAPELFADVESADICTDPKCFHKKEDAHRAQLRAEAEAKGMTVIEGKEAKELRPNSWSDEISGYLDLDKPLPGSDKPLRKVLGKDAPTPVLFIDPHTKLARNVVPAVEARKVLKDKGVATKVPKQRSEEDAKAAADREKLREKVLVENTWRARAMREISASIRQGRPNSFSGPILRAIVKLCLASLDTSMDEAVLLEAWGLPAVPRDPKDANSWKVQQQEVEALQRHVEAAPDTDLGCMFLQLLMACEQNVSEYAIDTDRSEPTFILQLANETGVDVTALQKGVKAERKAALNAEAKEKAAKEAAKAKKAPAATLSAAQAQGEPEGKDAGAAAPAKGRTKRGVPTQPKLSTEAAKSGIADAMQNMDPASTRPFTLGQKVKFKQDLKGLGGKLRKVCGREGTIEKEIGDRAYLVRFGEKGHEVATADYTELEAIENSDVDVAAVAGSIDPHAAWPFKTEGA